MDMKDLKKKKCNRIIANDMKVKDVMQGIMVWFETMKGENTLQCP
jgi:hypothetical protein